MRLLRLVVPLISCAWIVTLSGETAAASVMPQVATGQDDDAAPVRVAVVVRDSKGQPVAGLQASDFELLVDGAAQAIDSVERARREEPPRRVFALVLDEFHTDAADSGAVHEALTRFVDRHLRPSDLAVIVKPLDPLTSIVPDDDRDTLREELASFQGRKGDYAPRTDFERDYMAQAPAAVAAARAQIVTSVLRAVATGLAGRGAGVRPVIVLVSDGFGRTRTGRDLPANLQAAIRVANRADAPVYAFAPGLAPPPPGERNAALDALSALAGQTGGELVTGTAAFDSGLARMASDLDTHYVVTYRAPHGHDGRFHALKVNVRRDGAQVRAQAGYVAPRPASAERAADASPAPPRILRRSPLIHSWAGFVPTGSGRGLVSVTWEPRAPRPGTRTSRTPSSVVVTASAVDGTPLFDAAVGPATTPPGGVANIAMFEAPAGPIRIDMKILDDQGVVLDTDARDLVPPETRRDLPVIFSPAVLRTRSAREFRAASTDVKAAPVATREFRRTDRLIVRVAAVDGSGASLQAAAVLLNRWRQPMRTLPLLEGPTLPNLLQFDLPLAPLAPGEYSVRITAAGSAGQVSEYVTFRVQG